LEVDQRISLCQMAAAVIACFGGSQLHLGFSNLLFDLGDLLRCRLDGFAAFADQRGWSFIDQMDPVGI
jgi:hypothetical protein